MPVSTLIDKTFFKLVPTQLVASKVISYLHASFAVPDRIPDVSLKERPSGSK